MARSRSSRLSRIRRRPATVALVAWTFLVWTTRIGTIWEDDELSGAGKVGRTALALSFTLLALAVVVTLVRRSAGGRPAAAVDALAAWTTAVWAVRAPGIVLADHGAAFTVVHVVLAAVSIVLAYLAFRESRRPAPTARGDADAPAVTAPTG